MSDRSKIEWTDASYTPIRALNPANGKIGWHCEHATTGCEFCYAEGMNKRLGTGLPFKPGHRKDIEIFLDEKMLTAPMHWRKPRMIFCCSMTDLFADFVKDEWIDKIFAVMALCQQHQFQVLTKRAERMRTYFADPGAAMRIFLAADEIAYDNSLTSDRFEAFEPKTVGTKLPIPNVWLGTSCERQQEADERIPLLLQTPAAVRFVSCEPLLGALNLEPWLEWPDNAPDVNDICWGCQGCDSACDCCPTDKAVFISNEGPIDGDGAPEWINEERRTLDWIICGGESGHGARPMNPQWARDIRDQCAAAGAAFFHKQNGEFASVSEVEGAGAHHYFPDGRTVRRVGKKAAGRSLDGVEHSAFPR